MRAEVDVSRESSRGMWLTGEEKCVTEDMDTRASVVSPRRPQRRFLMGEARSGNWRGKAGCTGPDAPGCWMQGERGHEGLA